ncbi:hypothetical protein [Tenacibaculum soleae]|uniref:hypothetical protein n=1 Tax=Tenacibaculum soleae TaxID=447689 RepID=UPI002300BE1D|nr:hypothetical protein [Tenacibaculum soleae]
MDSLSFITTNWQFITLIIGAGGGGGWLGWLFASESRKIDLHSKVFKMNSEMIDAIKSDFEDRLQFFQEINVELDRVIKEQRNYIKKITKENSLYRNKYGKLNET